jgi:TPR repeat protein
MWSCTYKSPPSQEIENADTGEWIYGNATSKPREELERLVLTGDINSYEELHIAYLDFNEPSLLPYALLMANKYDYTMAYYDVYDCLTMLYWNGVSSSISLDSLDKQTRAMALKYLKKAADKGDINALRELGKLYLEGKHVKKDTILGNQLLEKYRKQSKNIR